MQGSKQERQEHIWLKVRKKLQHSSLTVLTKHFPVLSHWSLCGMQGLCVREWFDCVEFDDADKRVDGSCTETGEGQKGRYHGQRLL